MRIKIDFFIYNIFRAIFGFIEDVSNVLSEYSDGNNCTPPKNTIVMIVEDHPGTIDSLPERYMMNTQIAKANAIKMESVPNDMANFNGFLEKPKIPAEANENIFRMEYFVLPAARSLRV